MKVTGSFLIGVLGFFGLVAIPVLIFGGFGALPWLLTIAILGTCLVLPTTLSADFAYLILGESPWTPLLAVVFGVISYSLAIRWIMEVSPY